MKPLKVVSALIKDEPINVDERLEKLEIETSRKIEQFEEALGVFKDLVIKLYEEKEQLKIENESLKESLTKTACGVKEAVSESIVKPLVEAGEGFVELLMENEEKPLEQKIIGNQLNNGNQSNIGFNPNTDEMERTISWMREKFGLPSKQTVEAKPKAKPKKKRK